MSEIGRIAEDIVDYDLYLTGTDRDVGISRASGWLLNNFGQLNNRIYTNYSGEDPGLKYEEQSIYKSMYLSNYYKGKAASVIRNMDSSTIEWLSLREGDSAITLQNKNEVAKTYIQIHKETKEEIENLITSYNLYQAYPRQVDISYADLQVTGQQDRVIIIESYLANGSVTINSGEGSVFIPLNLDQTPSKISLSLVKPSAAVSNLSYSIVGTSITNTGFLVSLGARAGSGYKINYGVS